MTDAASPPLAPVYGNILDMVGNTPMIELQRMDTGPCRLFVKMESQNPGSSIKDRIAIRMVEAAERKGSLKPGGHIIEATAGNTGLSLALIAAQKGYKCTLVIPDKVSDEKISHVRAMGARVVLTRSDVEKGDPEYYQDIAARIAAEDPDALYIDQFNNDANVAAHHDTTGPEIWDQMEHDIDAFVAGVGSGGTVSGIGGYLKEQDETIQLVLADPEGSILAPKVNEGRDVKAGSWLVEGVGEDFVPSILDLDLVDTAITVPDSEAFSVARELLMKEGILAGSSVGTLLGAALEYCRRQTEPRRVVTLICDHGAKYLSKMFNDHWMTDKGFIDRETHGNLRDLIGRRHLDREDYVLSVDIPLGQAIKRMAMYAISQMVVMDDTRVAGIIDESDVLMAMVHDPDNTHRPVSDFMTRRLETLSPDASVNDLIPVFKADRVAIVMDEENYYGLITKIDLINFLRKQLP